MRRILPVLLLAACGGHDHLEAGRIDVTVYGEDFIESGIPQSIFVDDWQVTFDAFEVNVGGISAEAGHHGDVVEHPDFTVHDLAIDTGGDGQVVAMLDAAGGVYDHFGYVIDGVTVAGSATDGVETVTFAWDFPVEVVHSHCDVMVTVDGTTERVEITLHGDHLFFTDADATDPEVAFQAIAEADGADGSTPDGAITQAELTAVDVSSIGYDPGSLPLTDLWEFVQHQVTTIGHVDGDHHCEAEVL